MAATCPVQNEVIKVNRHPDVSSPNNEDSRGEGLRPHASEKTYGETLPCKIKRPVGSKQPHAGTLFGAATCRVQRDVMKAASSCMQTVVEAGAWLGESTSTTG